MIAGTELVATEEPSLPRMSDGEDNDDLYDFDAPSEESERDEDSPQGSRVDISWLTNSDPAASTSSAIASLVPTSTVVTNSPAGASMDAAPATAPTNAAIDALLVKITGTELAIQDLQAATRRVKMKLLCGKLSTNWSWRTELPSASTSKI
jgi:hypothetical protein